MSTRRYALVAGGGTGGHLVPALAVARALGEGHGPDAVELVGARRGLDAELLAGEGVPATLLPGRGIARRLDARSLLGNLGAVAGLAAAFVAALVIVIRRRPSVVVAMGGYACVPTALAAAVVGIPVVLVNVDAVPGAANRLVGRFARGAAVAFEGTALPRSVVTGAPVRAAIVRSAHPDDRARAAARHALGLPGDRLVVAAVGGSLGSKRLNEACLGLAGLWARRGDVALYHVVGRRDWSWAAQVAPETPAAAEHEGLCYIQIPYEEQMALLYQAADVVVSRAGANTVAELAVVGVPSILVPLPGAPGDHQRANAGVLERAGAAVVISDFDCDAARLATEIDALAADPGRLDAMGAAAVGWDALTRCRRSWRWPAPMPARPTGEPRRPMPAEHAMAGAASGRGGPLHPSRPRRVHVVGAGGAGMSAIASVLAAMGHAVTGSDLKTSPTLERLAAGGVKVFVGHDAAHVADAEVVAVSTAIPESNPEVVEGPPSRLGGAQPSRGAGRHRGVPPLRRRVGDPRQDHDHFDVGADPDRGRVAPELSHRG